MKLALLLFAGLSLYAQTGRQVVLNWTASTTPGVSYNVYRGTGSCVPTLAFTKLNANPVTAVTYTDNNVAIGTYCYHVTAELAGLESVPSNSVGAPVPPLAPSGLTVNVTVAVNVTVNGVEVAQSK